MNQSNPSPEPNSQPLSQSATGAPAPSVTILAKNLNLQTLQGLTVNQDKVIVPTLAGELLQIAPDGKTSVLVDLLKADLGIPYGLTTQDGDVIATVSGYDPVHYLVRVKRDGTFSTIADLSEISGFYGAPFGVAVYNNSYIVAGSTDVVSGEGLLYSVSPQGEITKLVDLTKFGNSFSIVVDQNQFLVTQEKGHLLRITPTATEPVAVIADLLAAGLGHPFGLVMRGDDLFVSLGSGQLIKVDAAGTLSTVAELPLPTYGVPSGLAVLQDQLIVATNSGYLLRVQV